MEDLTCKGEAVLRFLITEEPLLGLGSGAWVVGFPVLIGGDPGASKSTCWSLTDPFLQDPATILELSQAFVVNSQLVSEHEVIA